MSVTTETGTVTQVETFEPGQLADVLSAYANMVHHPGALIEPLNQRLLPKLDSMDAGQHLCSLFAS